MANRKERRAAARNKGKNENETDAIVPDAVLDGDVDPASLGDAVPFPDHEEDVLFKTQMRVLNLLLGHWKKGLAVGGVILLGVLAYGEYHGFKLDEQRDFQPVNTVHR